MNNKETSDKDVAKIEENIKRLESLKKYLNLLIYEGKHKIYYNDLGWDEKTIDCINAIDNILAEREQNKKIIQELKEENRKKSIMLICYQEDCESKQKAYDDCYCEYKHYKQFESIPKQKVKDVLQKNRNELFTITYVSEEQYEPYKKQIDRINKIEQELLEGEK